MQKEKKDHTSPRKEFIEQVYNLYSEGYKLLRAWEKLDDKAKDNTANSKYPFVSSFDEVLAALGEWIIDIEETFDSIGVFSPTITVGELKDILQHVDNDRQVVVGNYDNYYGNIESVNLPDDDSYVAFTLNISGKCDPTQF